MQITASGYMYSVYYVSYIYIYAYSVQCVAIDHWQQFISVLSDRCPG